MSAISLVERLQPLELIPYVPRDGSWKSNGSQSVTTSMVVGSTNSMSNEAGQPANWQLGGIATGVESFGNTYIGGISFLFFGRAIGLRVRRDSTYPSIFQIPDFKIDRRLYRGSELRVRWADGPSFANDGVGDILIATDVADTPDGRPHLLEVIYPQNRTTGKATANLLVYGLLVDKISGGYKEQPRYGAVIWTGAVPTSAAAIPVDSGGAGVAASIKTARAITRVLYKNTNAAARTVTISVAANDVQAYYLAATGSVGDSVVLDFGRPVVPDTSGTNPVKQVASGVGVNAAVFGEW